MLVNFTLINKRCYTKGAFGEFAGFYRWDAKKTSGSDPLVFLRPSGFEKIQPTEKSIGYSARHLNPTFLYGGFFNLNEVSRAK